jgi:hypothetical protein
MAAMGSVSLPASRPRAHTGVLVAQPMVFVDTVGVVGARADGGDGIEPHEL